MKNPMKDLTNCFTPVHTMIAPGTDYDTSERISRRIKARQDHEADKQATSESVNASFERVQASTKETIKHNRILFFVLGLAAALILTALDWTL